MRHYFSIFVWMNIKNIIFDLGGVIIDINYNLAADAFKKLGITDFDNFYSKAKQSSLFDDFEKGLISNQDFRNALKIYLPAAITNSQIDEAWNAMLLGIPSLRVDFLQHIASRYRIFLLSNTNRIHIEAFTQYNDEKFGKGYFESIFEYCYFSSDIGMRKPDAEIFEFVLAENGLLKEETIFIDDSIQHIQGALEIGLNAELLKVENGERIEEKYKYLLGN
jgi:putative hydrolase of the HAD superfamily